MHQYLPLLCFGGAMLCFARAFALSRRLDRERTTAPAGLLVRSPWLPGQFTETGLKIRKDMTYLAVMGVALIGAGFLF